VCRAALWRNQLAASSLQACRPRVSSTRKSLKNDCLDGATALSKYVLKLYVSGSTPRSQMAIANLRRICEAELGAQYDLEIIDVLEHPQIAEDHRILATPTLVKQLPPPLRRVIGDLSDREKVLLGLELVPGGQSPTPNA
jgi:circadian clock protein KaiB